MTPTGATGDAVTRPAPAGSTNAHDSTGTTPWPGSNWRLPYYSVLAALVHRDRTGLGQQIEIPMTDTLLAFNPVEHLAGHVYEPVHGTTGFPLSLSQGHRAVR